MTELDPITSFYELMREARPIPLVDDQVRIDRRRAVALAAELAGGSASGAMLQQLVVEARKVPLTGQIRLDPKVVLECLGKIRAEQ